MQFSKYLCLLLSMMVMCQTSVAKDLGVYGAVFVIKERSLLEVIKARVATWQATNSMAAKVDQLLKDIREHFQHVPTVNGITPAIHARVWLFDPSVIIQKPVLTVDGKVLAVPGQVINPLHQVSLTQPLLFVNLNRASERAWLLQTSMDAMVIAVGGDVLSIQTKSGHWVYLDQYGVLTQRLGIVHTPTLVKQVGDQLQLMEVVV